MSAEEIIIGARLLQFASILILFGSSLFYLYGIGVADDAAPVRAKWPWRIILSAAIGGFLSAILWLMGQTVSLMEDTQAATDPSSLWLVLSETQTGQFCLLRLGLLLLSIVLLFALKGRPRLLWGVLAVIGGILTASFAWAGHGARDQGVDGIIHLAADVFHLLAAGVWIGALVPLAFLILRSHTSQSFSDARATHAGLISFSGIGVTVVAFIVLTGVINSWFLIGLSHWRDLFTTAYGIALVVKIVMFGLMLLLAAVHRFWLTPRLDIALIQAESMPSALRALRTSILAETILAMLVLAAVAFLGTQPPPITGG